jgi:tRNA(Ile)-lysidine synthase TilS/MesJ
MRTLALNYDSGFRSDQSKENLKNAIERLGIDYVEISSKRDIQQKCLKDNIEAWVLKPSSEPFPDFCHGCGLAVRNGAYTVAAQLEVPLLILGESRMEKSDFKRVLIKSSRNFHKSNAVRLMKKYARNPLYLHPRRLYDHLLLEAEFPLIARIHRYSTRRPPRIVQWFDYVRYDEATMISTVSRELGWRKPLDASPWRFDCQIHAIIDLMFRRRLGFSENDELYSKMIREGSLSRAEALRRLEAELGSHANKLLVANELLMKLRLTDIKERLFQAEPLEKCWWQSQQGTEL